MWRLDLLFQGRLKIVSKPPESTERLPPSPLNEPALSDRLLEIC